VAGKQRFSGAGPSDNGQSAKPAAKRDRLVRMAPPANDNRGQGISLGRLRFTGLRVFLALSAVAAVALVAAAFKLI
jgi:hypothetical protein